MDHYVCLRLRKSEPIYDFEESGAIDDDDEVDEILRPPSLALLFDAIFVSAFSP